MSAPDTEDADKPDLSWYFIVWLGFLILFVAVAIVDLQSDSEDAGTATGGALAGFFLVSLVIFALRGFAKRQHDQTSALTSVAAAAERPVDEIDALARLADLRDRGVLTESEFQAKKAELLRRPSL